LSADRPRLFGKIGFSKRPCAVDCTSRITSWPPRTLRLHDRRLSGSTGRPHPDSCPYRRASQCRGSCTSPISAVKPHATCSLCPAITNGIPAASRPPHETPARSGRPCTRYSETVRLRCISFESSGFPLAVCFPSTNPVVRPAAHSSQLGSPNKAQHRARINFAGRRAGVEGSSSSSSSPVLAGGGSWLRLGQVQHLPGGRTIAPRTDRIKIGFQIGGCPAWLRCVPARAWPASACPASAPALAPRSVSPRRSMAAADSAATGTPPATNPRAAR